MSENLFLLPEKEYQRDIHPVQDWLKQTALYASKMLNKPYIDCYEHLLNKLKTGKIHFKDPKVVYFRREDNGDRHRTEATLSSYIKEAIAENDIIAPTLTTLHHPEIKRAPIVNYLDKNVKQRKVYKKLSQKFEAEGDKAKKSFFNQMQDCCKRRNNAASGNFVADGSIIQNKSSHAVLTSMTRSIASISNASNERLIEGNRHYYSPQIALNNILSIVSVVNREDISLAMTEWNLVTPSIDDVVSCVAKSLSKYVRGNRALKEIRAFVEKLDGIERAAVVYTGDLYHIRKHNESFVRQFITELSKKGSTAAVTDAESRIHATDELVVNYAHQINITMMEGKGKDYSKLTEDELNILANTCISIETTVRRYKNFIKAFFLTKNSPATISTIKSLNREAVVLSDTDSTMFSTDTWGHWYFGQYRFRDEDYAVNGAVSFMAVQSIAHLLAIFSANLGAERSRLFTLAMKPEFVFPVFAQTSVAKHYYTAKKVKEGNVYKYIDMEIKGVHMKDSAVPGDIIELAAKQMEDVIRTIMSGELISLTEKLNVVSDMEKKIVSSLYSGDSEYLKRFKIKEASSYKLLSDKSPYQYYTLWQNAFAKSYGDAPPPPYDGVRVPLELSSPRKVQEWLDTLEDRELALNFATWFKENNKTRITSFPIPYDVCVNKGIPKELKQAMNTRKIVLTLTKSLRNVLESLGYYTKNESFVTEQIGGEINIE